MYQFANRLSGLLKGLPLGLLAFAPMVAGTALPTYAQASSETATGVVLDQAGDPVIGASVTIDGTNKGVNTDINGKFTIKAKKGTALRVSCIGYGFQVVKWEGQPLTVTLTETANALDEVVVVGFGTQKKANLTGAVSTVSGKEIAARPVNNVSDALQGMAAGLNVLGANNGGQLNSTRSMQIRGASTIGAGSSVSPLILIDGMEGDINALNPADVENISVLKDAAAASIYGSRAAGGVILITTRNGKEGNVQVNYSDSFRWSAAMNMPKMASSYQWANYMNQCSVNNGGGVWFTDDKLEQLKAVESDPSLATMFRNPANNQWEVWDVTSLLPTGNTDWLETHFGKTSFSQEHNLSVTGGTSKYNYYFSSNYLNQGGILRYGDDNAQRYTVNAKVNVKFFDWLTFGYSNRWSRNDYNSPANITGGSNEFYHNVMRYWPIIPTHDPNGYPVVESYINVLENGGRYKTTTDRNDQQFSLVFNPIERLFLRAEANYRSTHYYMHRDAQQAYAWNCDGVATPRWPNGTFSDTRVWDSSQRANYFNPNIYGDYNFKLAEKHDFKVMAGFQSESYRYYSFNANRNGIINGLPFLSTTNGKDINVGGGTAAWRTAGFFGRLNYDFDNRYLFEANIRYDGTSRFRADSRWTWSPSFSFGWNVANEKFWEPLTEYCNQFKLRASWGRLGNQNTNSWYPTYATMGYYPNSSGWLVNGAKPTYATMPSLVSSGLTWEKNETWDIGADLSFLNNRLTATVDYYQRRTYDMVGPGKTLPTVLGASVPNVNNLSMTAKGWELTLSWRDRIGDFSYGITGNLYDYMTTIDDYPNENGDLNKYYKGRKLGEIWGLTTLGIAKTNEEMQAHLASLDATYERVNGEAPARPGTGQNQLGSGWRAGDIMYKDVNGDGVIGWGEWTTEDHGDYEVIGNSTPRFNYGVNLDATWKGLDLKVFFQGVGKRDYEAGGAPFWGGIGMGKWQALCFEEHLDYFRPEDTTDPLGPNLDAYYPAANWGGSRNTETQTRYLQNAAYCRLKNVTLGYTLPQSLTRAARIEKVRFYVSGENLATITKFSKTGDPELIEAYGQGYGYGKVYPLSRVFSCGLNVTF